MLKFYRNSTVMMTKKQFKEVLNFLCHMKYANKKYMMYLEVSGKDRYIMGMRNDFFITHGDAYTPIQKWDHRNFRNSYDLISSIKFIASRYYNLDEMIHNMSPNYIPHIVD